MRQRRHPLDGEPTRVVPLRGLRLDGSGAACQLTPGGEIKHASGDCAVYSKTNWSVSVYPADCAASAADPGLGTKWSHDPESGQLQASEWAPGDGVVAKGVPQNVPHCLLSPIANVNVSLGMAVLLRESGGGAAAKSVAVEAGWSSGWQVYCSSAGRGFHAQREGKGAPAICGWCQLVA